MEFTLANSKSITHLKKLKVFGSFKGFMKRILEMDMIISE